MHPEYEKCVENDEILKSLQRKIVLKGYKEHKQFIFNCLLCFSDTFLDKFLNSIDRIDDYIFQVIEDDISFENLNVDLYFDIISQKMSRGDEYYLIDSYNRLASRRRDGAEIVLFYINVV